MVSTYSTGLRTELQVTGENSGTWGTITNSNFTQVFEFAIAGVYAKTLTDGDTTLTNTDGPQTQANNEARQNTLILSGTLTAVRVVQFPATQKTYMVYNNTGGGYNLTLRLGASGNTMTVVNGKMRIVATDGTNWYDVFSLAGLGESWTEKATGDSPYTASDGDNIMCDCSSGAITITLPASPTIGMQVKVVDGDGNAGTNNITIDGGAEKVQGDAADMIISTNSAGVSLVYYDSGNGWRLKYND
jgi:hypothetical protein